MKMLLYNHPILLLITTRLLCERMAISLRESKLRNYHQIEEIRRKLETRSKISIADVNQFYFGDITDPKLKHASLPLGILGVSNYTFSLELDFSGLYTYINRYVDEECSYIEEYRDNDPCVHFPPQCHLIHIQKMVEESIFHPAKNLCLGRHVTKTNSTIRDLGIYKLTHSTPRINATVYTNFTLFVIDKDTGNAFLIPPWDSEFQNVVISPGNDDKHSLY